ncbi:MAG: hypothetical protein HQL72_00120 [Magnetococcales bacterium]|nr:hypothetical protein [Magnetococcales bacterium]
MKLFFHRLLLTALLTTWSGHALAEAPMAADKKPPCNGCETTSDGAESSNRQTESRGFKTFGQASDRGSKLWSDPSLGRSGFTCLSGGCHGEFAHLNFDANQNYPHYVEMTEKVVTLTQMINYCLVNPMAGPPLNADSDEMTAMAAFYRSYRIQYRRQKKND